MAVLLNQASNLRLRLDLERRLSDGVRSPASLQMRMAVERYVHAPPGSAGGKREHAFAPLVEIDHATLFDMDLIAFLGRLEEILDGSAPPAPEGELPQAALEVSVEPTIGLRLLGGPDAFLVEIGIDLLHVLEAVGGEQGERCSNLVLYRFTANQRAALAFCKGLLDEFAGFPTDPSKVHPGDPG